MNNKIKIINTNTVEDEFGNLVVDRSLEPKAPAEGDVGWDIRAPHDIVLYPGCRQLVDTGLVVQCNDVKEVYCTALPRSSTGTKWGVRLSNTYPVVDPNYSGPGDTIKLLIERPSAESLRYEVIPPPKKLLIALLAAKILSGSSVYHRYNNTLSRSFWYVVDRLLSIDVEVLKSHWEENKDHYRVLQWLDVAFETFDDQIMATDYVGEMLKDLAREFDIASVPEIEGFVINNRTFSWHFKDGYLERHYGLSYDFLEFPLYYTRTERGLVFMKEIENSKKPLILNRGDRFTQLIFHRYVDHHTVECESRILTEGEDRGGFGSTGIE